MGKELKEKGKPPPSPSEGGDLPNGINMIILKYGETN